MREGAGLGVPDAGRGAGRLAMAVFALFTLTLVAATVVLAPGWGMMDDPTNLEIARSFWSDAPSPSAFARLVGEEMRTVGRFRPMYTAWRVAAYALFAGSPTALSAVAVVVVCGGLLLWGTALTGLWPPGAGRAPAFDRYVLPLASVVFTPFINLLVFPSLQETAVFVFAAAALAALAFAYRNDHAVVLLPALAAVAVAVASKETAVALLAALLAFALLDLVVLRWRPRLSAILLAAVVALTAAETAVVLSVWRGSYSHRYTDNLGLTALVSQLASMPKPVLLLAVGAIVLGAVAMTPPARRSGLFPPGYVVFPAFVAAYVLVLAPWGYVSYMLALLAPFAVGLAYPLLLGVDRVAPRTAVAVRAGTVVAIAVVTAGVVLPRVAREADIRGGVEVVAAASRQPGAVLLLAPPHSETATSLSLLTGADIEFLDDGRADGADLPAEGPVYLLMEYRSDPVRLDNLGVGPEVLANRYWRIVRLRRRAGHSTDVAADLDPGVLQRILDVVKL